jgi:hypothetical protein
MENLSVFFLPVWLAFSWGTVSAQDERIKTTEVALAVNKLKQTVLSEAELLTYVTNYSLAYSGGQHGTCDMSFKSDHSLAFFCNGPNFYDTGEWSLRPNPKDARVMLCRKLRQMGEACNSLARDEEGNYYIGLAQGKQSKVLGRKPL